MSTSESVHSSTRTHNPCGEVRRASRMRENLTYGSYGEGLETDRCSWPAPRQSLTRQLLFRELKCQYRMAEIPSKNVHITEALIYSALLSLIASRRLHTVIRNRIRLDSTRMNFDRWAVLFSSICENLLELLVGPKRHYRYLENRLTEFIRFEAEDPNVTRKTLVQRAQAGIMEAA
jgi:hypothetical protein